MFASASKLYVVPLFVANDESVIAAALWRGSSAPELTRDSVPSAVWIIHGSGTAEPGHIQVVPESGNRQRLHRWLESWATVPAGNV